jgi:hypothetical protein
VTVPRYRSNVNVTWYAEGQGQYDVAAVPLTSLPRISPPDQEMILQTGVNLTLTCYGSSDITWKYPIFDKVMVIISRVCVINGSF